MNTMTPQGILKQVFSKNKPTVVTTSFGNQSAVLLHMVAAIEPNAMILWLDTNCNTPDTLKFKDYI